MPSLAADLLLLPALMHALHLLGAISWIGGMIFTSLVVSPILRRELPEAERLRLVERVGRRFRMVEGVAFLLLFSSGFYKVAQLGRDFDWAGSAAGRILLVKLTLVAVVLVLSVLHGAVWGPRLVKARAGGDPKRVAALTARVVLGARLELAVALAIVLCGALLRMNPF